MGVHGGAAGQATEQGDDGKPVERAARHRLEREAQCPAPADPHQHAIPEPLSEGSARSRCDDMGNESLAGRSWHHNRLSQIEALAQLRLKRHAFGQAAGDADLHQTLFARLGQQAIDADTTETEPLADLRLGEAAHEIKPGGAGGLLLVAVEAGCLGIPLAFLHGRSACGRTNSNGH